MENPAGESNDGALQLDFDRRLKLECHGSRITSDAGLLTYRELDDALGLTHMVGDELVDPRTGKNGQHEMTGLFRPSVFGRLGGYKYTIRLNANAILQQIIACLLTRPVGRPPNHVVRSYASFSYQAGLWDRKRRVVAKVE
jgi:Transposase DDE domain group 1